MSEEEIICDECLSIPFMGYFIIKYEDDWQKFLFQFPLWDTFSGILRYNWGELNFQFPLWDTYIFPIFNPSCWKMHFQFPLWDTAGYKICCFKSRTLSIPFMGYETKNAWYAQTLTGTFNSLYGIPLFIKPLLYRSKATFNSLYGIQSK